MARQQPPCCPAMGGFCSKDDQKAWCACVLCKRQCGTNGCCQKDTDGDGQCCASVCCGVQCNIGLCGACLGSAVGGGLCCAGQAIKNAGAAAGAAAGDAAVDAVEESFEGICFCGKECCLLGRRGRWPRNTPTTQRASTATPRAE